jgi:SAM-dependent methyltransferase
LSSYRELHARYYDVVYGDKPYADEARFVAERLGQYGAAPPARLLDIACGTGRHAVEFAALGYSVTGVDHGESLLAHARKRAAARGVKIEFVNQDMRRLQFADGGFQAATCLFDSIGYAITSAGVIETLQGIRSQLVPAGVLAVEFLHSAAMVRHASPVRVGRWETSEGSTLLRISESHLELDRQLLRVGYELVELKSDGTYARSIEEQANRYFSVEEMRALLANAGLAADLFVPAYEEDGPITDRSWHILALAHPSDGR